MTESDLRDARVAVEDRIESGRQRDRRRGVVVAAAAAAVVVGVATWQGLSGKTPVLRRRRPDRRRRPCRTRTRTFLTGDAVTAEILPGVWRLDNRAWLFMFTSDGRFSYDEHRAAVADPLVDGTYAVDGDTITVDIEGGTAGCAGQTLTLRAVVFARARCTCCPSAASRAAAALPSAPSGCWSRCCRRATSPGSRTGPGGNWDPLAGYGAMQGTWYDPQGGYLVELRDDGSYSTLTGSGRAGRPRHLDRRPIGHPAQHGQRGGLADVSRGGPVRPRQPAGEGRSASSTSRATSDATTATWRGRAPRGSAGPVSQWTVTRPRRAGPSQPAGTPGPRTTRSGRLPARRGTRRRGCARRCRCPRSAASGSARRRARPPER